MSIYRAPEVSEQPSVNLTSWRIFETPEGDRHFCGTIPEDAHDGRVSSKIMSFDTTTMTGETRSGRRYKLVGGPGSGPDSAYVLGVWLRVNGIDRDTIKFVDPENISA